MYKDLLHMCTAIALLIKPFVSWRSRCRCRRNLLNLLTGITTCSKYIFYQELQQFI